MVSKGVDYYTFMTEGDFAISVTGPKVGRTCSPSDNFQGHNLQIDSGNLPWGEFIGDLQWSATIGGVQQSQGNASINTVTGDTDGGTMSNMLGTPSTIRSDFALSYGFYDAGAAIGTPLTNQDQLYLYFTPNYSAWMGEMMAARPEFGALKFARFVLPGAHDSGMFTLDTVNAILSSPHAETLLKAISQIPIIGPVIAAIDDLAASQVPRVVTNLAITQKDNIATMLSLGIRYFDFRPGPLYGVLNDFSPGVLYHQHAVIPGCRYIDFLGDVIAWLVAHPTEIVVVSANAQGILGECPTQDQVDGCWTTAVAQYQAQHPGVTFPIIAGDKAALQLSYQDLIRTRTRLIFLNQIAKETNKYDSYCASTYATVSPAPLLAAFDAMNARGQQGYDYTVLQMQGTATGIGASVVVPAILSASEAYSPLMSTKGSFDIQTNQWLLQRAAKFEPEQLLVLLNDFADNCMTKTAIDVTTARMETA